MRDCTHHGCKRFRSSCFHSLASYLGGLQRHARDPHGQFHRIDRDVRLIALRLWQLDGPLFEPPVPKRQSSCLPPQSLDAISLSIDEQEQRTVSDAAAERRGHDAGQTIKPFSKVDWVSAKIDGRAVGQTDHSDACSVGLGGVSLGTSTEIRTPPGNSIVVLTQSVELRGRLGGVCSWTGTNLDTLGDELAVADVSLRRHL